MKEALDRSVLDRMVAASGGDPNQQPHEVALKLCKVINEQRAQVREMTSALIAAREHVDYSVGEADTMTILANLLWEAVDPAHRNVVIAALQVGLETQEGRSPDYRAGVRDSARPFLDCCHEGPSRKLN